MRRRSDVVRIESAQALQYTMPLKRTFGTARGNTSAATNVLIVLDGTAGAATHTALGESVPRGSLTGDDLERSWSALCAWVDHVVGRELPLADRASARSAVAATVAELQAAAGDVSHDRGPDGKRCRGSLLGIEVALLDLVARAMHTSVADLLGKRRSSVSISANTISTSQVDERFADTVARQVHRYPILRCKGTGDVDVDLDRLRTAARIQHEHGRGAKPLWIDINQGMSRSQAATFVDALALDIAAGSLPAEVIVEQPVHRDEWDALPDLQRQADAALERSGTRILLMPDESLWDVDDLERIWSRGPCAAVNVKAPKTGGLLAAVELAERALAHTPDVRVYLGGMIGTSDVTAWTLRNLALALPGLHYTTAVPPSNVEARISDPLLAFRRGTNRLVGQRRTGIGTDLQLAKVLRFVDRSHAAASEASRRTGPIMGAADVNLFDDPHLSRFPKMSFDSHLIEREALRSGLTTVRLTRTAFVVERADGEPPVGFHWSAASGTSRFATIVAGDKQLTRAMLEDAGVAVPRGRAFAAQDDRGAVRYAKELGYPVVVKPATGTGGTGVASGVRDEAELRTAIRALERTRYAGKRFIVEEHLPGEDHRFLVIDGSVRSVIRRTPAHVIGDGRSSLAELVLERNRLRQSNPHLAASPIRLGDAAQMQLERQGLTEASVPDEGAHVVLATSGNLSQGGESREVLAEVHPSLLELACRAAAAVPGLGHVGIDVLLEDHRVALDAQRAGICELNSMPGIKGHCFPARGPARNVADELVRHYCGLPDGAGSLDAHDGALTVALQVRGHVQGVGYRRWLRRRAGQLDVGGWVRNDPDGQVVAEATGDWRAVTALAALAVRGPRGAVVDLVRSTPRPPAEGPRRFSIVDG